VNFLNVHQKLPVLLTLRRFGKDLKTFRAMVDTESPGNIVAAPGDYFLPFPFLGDLNFTKNLLKESLGEIDLLTWHLYATQSDRCPISPFPSTFEMLFSTAVINNSRKMAQYVKEASGGAVPVMNGESASCQCGGQTGVSVVMADALWWADWIGIMAEEGTSSIVRQTLVGSDYGMLDMDTFDPRPAFLVYVMHRRMAERLRLATDADRQEIKAHGYCSAETPGAVSAVLINPSAKTIVAGIGLKGNKIARAFQWTVSSGGDVNSKAASINGFRPLDDGTIPYPSGIPVHCENNRAYAKAAPYSVVFVDIVPVHAVALCQ
jgi:heparanase 1